MRSLRARTGRINCLRTDNQVFALLARFRPEVLFPQRVGSCERTIRCPAVRLRHIVSSVVALAIAVPLAIGVAVFITEMSPRWLRGSLAFTTELLAAIPSVIYGLGAIFILVPLLRTYVPPFLARYFGWTGLSVGSPYGLGIAGGG